MDGQERFKSQLEELKLIDNDAVAEYRDLLRKYTTTLVNLNLHLRQQVFLLKFLKAKGLTLPEEFYDIK